MAGTKHLGSHLEMGYDIVLDRLVVEGVHQHFITVTLADGIGNASDEGEELIGEIFVEVRLEAGLVEYVRQRSEASFFFVKLATVTDVQETFEVAKRDGWNVVSSSTMLVVCSVITYHASHTCRHLSVCGSGSTSAAAPTTVHQRLIGSYTYQSQHVLRSWSGTLRLRWHTLA